MVGVPGRSKGCITCRRRRVKCDEAKPACNKCQRGRRHCEGYAHDRIFVDSTDRYQWPQNHGQNAKPPRIIPEFDTKLSDSDSDNPQMRRDVAVRNVAINPRSLDLSAFHTNICLSFLQSRFMFTWAVDAMKDDPTGVIFNAAYAVAVTFFQRTHKLRDEKFAMGDFHYGKALQILSRNISDPVLCRSENNVVAVLTLSIYEMSAYQNTKAWIQHAGGLAKLIEMRGVEAHRHGIATFYFLVSRIHIFTQALAMCKRSFLEREDWKSIRWVDESNGPRAIEITPLMNIIASLPGLAEDNKRMRDAQSAPNKAELRIFKDRIVCMLRDLFLWRWEWECDNPNWAYEVSTNHKDSLTLDVDGTPLYPTIYYFHDFHKSRVIMLYNVAILVLLCQLAAPWNFHDAVQMAFASLPLDQAPTNPMNLPHPGLSQREVMDEMCRLVEYQLQGQYSILGAGFLILPVRYLFEFDRAKIPWLKKIATYIAMVCGFRAVERMLEEQFQEQVMAEYEIGLNM